MARTRGQVVGRWGEDLAARYLEAQGYHVLARNVRTPYGEIDLLVQSPGGELVFVEVKARTNQKFGFPEEAVDERKLEHIVSSAQAYLLENAGQADLPWRVDVIAVQGRPGQKDEDVCVEHFQNLQS